MELKELVINEILIYESMLRDLKDQENEVLKTLEVLYKKLMKNATDRKVQADAERIG